MDTVKSRNLPAIFSFHPRASNQKAIQNPFKQDYERNNGPKSSPAMKSHETNKNEEHKIFT